MHRTPRIMAMACAFLLTAPITASAQDTDVVDPTTEPAVTAPELVAASDYHGIDLALGPDGHRHIVASQVSGIEEAHDDGGRLRRDLWYATDRDGSWSTQRILKGDDAGLGWNDASIAVDDDGSVHIAVVHDYVGDGSWHTEGIFYLTDKDREPGAFSAPVRVARPDMDQPSLAVVDGVRYLAYSKRARLGDPPPPSPVFVKTDLSGSWVSHRLADDGSAPDLRVDPTGRAHIIYQAATADGRDSIRRYVQVDPETGEPTKSRRIPGTRDVWYSAVLALDPLGQPHIAWQTEKDIAWSRLTADGWSQPEMLGVRRSDGLSLVVDPLGQPHVVFSGRGDAGRGIIHAQRGAGTWPQSVLVDDVGWTQATSAMLGQDIVIAWTATDEREGLWSYGPVPDIDPAAMEAHAALEDLLASVTTTGCTAFTEQGGNDPFSYGALAALQCDKPARGVRQLALFRFPDASSMAEYWDWRVARIEPSPAVRDGACADGRRGRTRWAHGDLVCYVSPAAEAKLRWTDERTKTYGVLDARDRDIAGLHDAWLALDGTRQAE